jgi:hypothetical protein
MDKKGPVMNKAMLEKMGSQRVFQRADGQYVLLTKQGKAISFYIDAQDAVQIVEKLEGVDFKATGTQLKKEGWKCIGPGLEFNRLLEGEK